MDRVSAIELYGAFRRPPAGVDGEARAWANSVTRAADPRGAPSQEHARVLLVDAGLDGERIVAAPTGDTRVWVALAPSGAGSCGHPYELGLVFNGETRGGRTLCYGLVQDGVLSVRLEIGEAEHKARMGENCFALELPASSNDELTNVALELVDGSVRSIDLRG